MRHAVALLPAALLMIHCGGEPSVASKSAAAYREAQAKGVEIGGGHEHGGHAMAGTTGSAADAHAGHTMPNAGSARGATPDPHAGHSGARAISPASPDPHAGHTMPNARAGSPALHQDAHAGHTMPSAGSTRGATPDPHAGHSGARAISPAPSDPHAGHAMESQAGSPALQQDAHAGHAMPSAGSARGATPDPHAGHSGARATSPASPSPTPVIKALPNSNSEMRDLRPAATLQPDPFDAPAPASVSEAAKASGGQSAGHEGHKP